MGKTGKIKIITCDLSEQNYEYLKTDEIKLIIGQDGVYQGYESVMVLYRLLFNNEKPEQEYNYTEIVIKTKYNI